MHRERTGRVARLEIHHKRRRRSGCARSSTELWRIERPRVTQAVAEAAAQGDRSENAEYIYGKRRLREIDRRVRFLRQRLDGMVIVEQRPRIRGACSLAPG